MHTDTGTFTSRVQPRNVRFGPLVYGDTSHLVVRPRSDRDGAFNRVHPSKIKGQLPDLGWTLLKALARSLSN